MCKTNCQDLSSFLYDILHLSPLVVPLLLVFLYKTVLLLAVTSSECPLRYCPKSKVQKKKYGRDPCFICNLVCHIRFTIIPSPTPWRRYQGRNCDSIFLFFAFALLSIFRKLYQQFVVDVHINYCSFVFYLTLALFNMSKNLPDIYHTTHCIFPSFDSCGNIAPNPIGPVST